MTKSNGTPLYNNIVFHARARRDLARKATATRRSAGITTQFMKDNDKKKIFPYFNKVFFCRFAWKKFSLQNKSKIRFVGDVSFWVFFFQNREHLTNLYKGNKEKMGLLFIYFYYVNNHATLLLKYIRKVSIFFQYHQVLFPFFKVAANYLHKKYINSL